MAAPVVVYKPRNPKATDYHRCVEDHLEAFIQVDEERFERTYGNKSRTAWRDIHPKAENKGTGTLGIGAPAGGVPEGGCDRGAEGE